MSNTPSTSDKELANWIYYGDANFYCFPCVEERMDEINTNREFADEIDYESGDTCGYMQDYADVDYHVECCKCGKPLFSKTDC
jgi:hypothetical protein